MSKLEPLSIDSLLLKQKAEKEAASKPKFLSKEERANLAIARRAAELAQEKEKVTSVQRDREALEREAEQLRARERDARGTYGGGGGGGGGRYGGGGGGGGGGRYEDRYDRDGRDRDRYNRRDNRGRPAPPPPAPAPQGGGGGGGAGYAGVPTGPRADRSKAPPTGPSAAASSSSPAPSSSMPPPSLPPSHASTPTPSSHPTSTSTYTTTTSDSSSTYVPPMTSSDLSAIRSRYLGVDKKKRKIRKMNDRKFVFDWDEQEDTFSSADAPHILPEGVTRQGAQVMFGRGHIAGMDDGGNSSAARREAGGTGTGKGETGGKGETRAAVDPNLADPMERRKAAKAGYDDRHWTEKPLEDMKERDWRIFREDFSIAARGGNIPHPLRSWLESTIPQQILDVVDSVGYKEPSPIQRQAIPIGLQNRDIIGIAETGSGKTAAFVIPMLTFISKLPPFTDENRHLGPYSLILAPTRELAQQIESEARKFATPLGFKCVSIVGGRAVEEQQFNLREGAEIIIATPGRLKDVLERHVLVLSQCRYVVMDEADRMVHLGFEVDLTFILDKLPSETMEGEDTGQRMDVDGETMVNVGRTRVTTLFSATMPPAVERLARKYLKRPAIITIGEAGRAVDTVDQRVEFVIGEEKKKQRLLEILNNGGFQPPMIVFVNQKKTADQVAKDLSRAGWNSSTLHSGKNQEQREAALQALRNGDADVLVATDLAGRGIDVQDVSLVVNFQMANTIEAYVHRIGRTGRAGKQGVAITFLTNDDDEVMYDLKQEISKSPVSKVPPELARHESAQHKVSREMKRKREADDLG
ncbi:P-loop containing nucleoside triphosphate hydrolase protein, partial [Stereum hirsutum FP-91666 SS1]|uniref:P-loop containing nucleoside triphosphate hydrolase protein n=1 Tax=Stereum hirsutum (strain FP-91666) TaxID=721885 RepID=UPI000440CB5D